MTTPLDTMDEFPSHDAISKMSLKERKEFVKNFSYPSDCGTSIKKINKAVIERVNVKKAEAEEKRIRDEFLVMSDPDRFYTLYTMVQQLTKEVVKLRKDLEQSIDNREPSSDYNPYK